MPGIPMVDDSALMRWSPDVVDAHIIDPDALPPEITVLARRLRFHDVAPGDTGIAGDALARCRAAGGVIIPAVRARNGRLQALRSLWYGVCQHEQRPCIVLHVGPVTPFGRRLALEWDCDALEERCRDTHAASEALFDAIHTITGHCPRAVVSAMCPRRDQTTFSGGIKVGHVKATEGYVAPIVIVLRAVHAYVAGDTAIGAVDASDAPEWPSVAEARTQEASRPRRVRTQAPPRWNRCDVCDQDWSDAVGDRRRHARYHDELLNGLPVPPDFTDGSGLRVITPFDRVAVQKVATRLGVFMQRENGYDSNLVPPAMRRARHDDDERARYDTTCVVALREGRAVGLLVSSQRERTGWLDPTTMASTKDETGGYIGRHIDGVYVAPAHRRAGIAVQLACHVADTYAVAVHDLLHNPPFSDAGLAWAATLCAGRPLPLG